MTLRRARIAVGAQSSPDVLMCQSVGGLHKIKRRQSRAINDVIASSTTTDEASTRPKIVLLYIGEE